MKYEDFIARKRVRPRQYGFNVDLGDIHDRCFDWQKLIIQWAVKRGRAACFEECGLGKTLQELEWARLVWQHTGLPVMIHTPCGVRHQTFKESQKFGIQAPVAIVDDATGVIDGINLANYEKLHKFDTSVFGGVVLDESSILKNSHGKMRTAIIEAWKHVDYRLAATATPAPNDHKELCNHSEFLGVMSEADMLNRFFVHDSGNTSQWRLRKHAHQEFWSWIASWAVCIGKPSDIGGSDEGFDLPELRIHRHIVNVDDAPVKAGELFSTRGFAATTVHEEKRVSNSARCRKSAELAAGDEACIIWCDTDYEADELKRLIPDAIEIRGSHSEAEKERALELFSSGQVKKLISKPSISGWGMNWQHCRKMVFAGLSYSFESLYQAIRRCWRFGQMFPVDVHLVIAETESAIESAVSIKAAGYELMRAGMAEAMRHRTLEEFGIDAPKRAYSKRERVRMGVFNQTEGARS